MNIYALDKSPKVAASFLDDRRQNKLLLESAQIVAAGRFWMGKESVYGPGYRHHPICKWAGTEETLDWTARYFFAMGREFERRNRKVHASSIKMRDDALDSLIRGRVVLHTSIEFQNSAAHKGHGLDFKHIKDTVQAYRTYINERWKIEIAGGYSPVFTNRQVPEWADREVVLGSTVRRITAMTETITLFLAPGQWKTIKGIKVENTTSEMKRVKVTLPASNPG